MKNAFSNPRLLRSIIGLSSMILLAMLPACLHVHVDPVEVKPITLNINVRYVDDELDNFFAFEKKYQQNAPTTQPATRAVNDSQAINARYQQ
jgi:hypothetical protein